MGRNYERELKDRVSFIKEQLYQSGAKGVIYGNSGGKDSALVGILCRKATERVLGVMMPCHSKRNFGEDMEDGQAVARQFGIETVTVDLTAVKEIFVEAVSKVDSITDGASANIAPRLRMTTLYTLAHTKGYLVAGTGNRSEEYVGYFTKWGDGAYDFNPIADLTEDLAAEQKARVTYDNILRLSDDPDVNDVIKFLRAREIVHFQRFGEGLRLAKEKMDQKNLYFVNPSFDQ